MQAEEVVLNDSSAGNATTSNQAQNGSYDTIDGQHHGSSSLGYGTWQSSSGNGVESVSRSTSQQDSRVVEMPFGYNIAGIDHHLSRQTPCYPGVGYSDHTYIPSSQSSVHGHATGQAMTWSNQATSSNDAATANPVSAMDSTHGNFESRQLPVPTNGRSGIDALNENGIIHSQSSACRDASAMASDAFAQGDFNGMHADSCPAAQVGNSLAPLPSWIGTGWPPGQPGEVLSSYNNGKMGPPVTRFNPNSIEATTNQRRASHDHPIRSSSSLESSRSYSLPTNHHLSRSASDYNLYNLGSESFHNFTQETPAPQLSHMRSQGQSNNSLDGHSVDRRQSNPSPRSGSSSRANGGSYLRRHQ